MSHPSRSGHHSEVSSMIAGLEGLLAQRREKGYKLNLLCFGWPQAIMGGALGSQEAVRAERLCKASPPEEMQTLWEPGLEQKAESVKLPEEALEWG